MLTEAERQAVQQIHEFFSTPPERRTGPFDIDDGNPLPEVGELHKDVQLRSGLTAEVVVPKGAGRHPIAIMLHGGGFVAGSAESYRRTAMEFAHAGYLTINLEYRLAPHHPFPAAFEDTVYAAKWAAENAARWNGDPSKMILGGESAGANLSAAALLELAADRSAPKFAAAILIYGVFDLTKMPEPPKAYVGGNVDLVKDPRVSPLLGLKPGSFPPTFLISGTADFAMPQSFLMAEALRRNEVPYELHVMEAMPHVFMEIPVFRARRQGLRLIFEFLERHIGPVGR